MTTAHVFTPSLLPSLCICGRSLAGHEWIPDQRAARDTAIERVEMASPDWRSFATQALHDVARAQPELTSDDVWHALHRYGIPPPREPRAMGPVMLGGVRHRWLVRTNRTLISSEPASPNHRRPQAVYRSRLVER